MGNAVSTWKHNLQCLVQMAGQGDVREESFYPALADLIRQVAQYAYDPHLDPQLVSR